VKRKISAGKKSKSKREKRIALDALDHSPNFAFLGKGKKKKESRTQFKVKGERRPIKDHRRGGEKKSLGEQ